MPRKQRFKPSRKPKPVVEESQTSSGTIPPRVEDERRITGADHHTGGDRTDPSRAPE